MIKFSIIIPVKSINNYIREAVPHIQGLQSDEWELIILPNELDCDEWSDGRIKIIATGRVGPAAKRDLGAKYAEGEILVFLDDDSYPNPDLLKIAAPHFMAWDVVAIGGPAITPPSNNFWQKVSGSVFLSGFSGGNPERYIPKGKIKEVDDWPSVNFMVRKKDFLQIGGFSTQYWPGEDTKLCFDLLEGTGKKILYDPQLIVWHHRRSGWQAHMRQVGAYGRHRGYFFRKFPKNSRKIKYLLPSIFVFYILMLLILNIFYPKLVVYVLPFLGIYITTLIFAWIDIVRHVSRGIASFAIIYIVSTHFWYGLNFINGLFTINLKSKLN